MRKRKLNTRSKSPAAIIKWLIALFAVGIISKFVSADNIFNGTFPANTAYTVCFTPGGDCTGVVVNNIDQARNSIYVQAYSFTSTPIARALANAERRGINVDVILDKSQDSGRYNIIRYLKNNNIPVWIDYQPAIAHNKVMIIDRTTVITGSFNFTSAAQNNNAENLLVIKDGGLAIKYYQNWQNREKVSEKVG